MFSNRTTLPDCRAVLPRRRHRCAAAYGLLALAVPMAQAAQEDAEPRDPGRGYCSFTAGLLSSACRIETRTDLLVAQAKCVNIGDAVERADCMAEARSAQAESLTTCDGQLESRRAACRLLGEARYDPPFEPHRFDADFRALSRPNPYFPLGIGYRWEFRGGGEVNTIEVANETKLIDGVTCIVLRDEVYKQGALVEATDDWYAAGRDGSTWYCGEEVKDYESFAGDKPKRPELVSISGSFKQGRDHDKAGIIMPAAPKAGLAYLEEFSLANAEDISEILSSTYAWGNVPELDQFVPKELALSLCGDRDCVATKNYSLLEPGISAIKYYARGIGFFLEVKPNEGKAVQLVDCSFDARCKALPKP